jgi:hypothetical protein
MNLQGLFDTLSPLAEKPSLVRVEPSMRYFLLRERQYAQWMYVQKGVLVGAAYCQ